MASMRAVVVEPEASGRLSVAEVQEPDPAPSEALVRVAAVSLNRGEVRRAEWSEPGFRPGWDLAGTVESAAADGSGPQEGSRVVGFLPSGAWAELACVPTDSMAVLPEGVSYEEASTLPVAGLTALYALEEGGNLLGRSVLVTGASGGAGQFGLQLARAAGARVVALVRQEEHAGFVEETGAHEVIVDESGAAAGEQGPYHLIIESVGGSEECSVYRDRLPEALHTLYPERPRVQPGMAEANYVSIDTLR
jgi:NADPH:quinone reductase